MNDLMTNVYIYVDDLLVSSPSFNEHLQRLRILFRKIAMEKLIAIRSFPKPRTKKELQSLIGFCNFYWKFADYHASLIAHLINLIK